MELGNQITGGGSQATKEDLRRQKRQCWSQGCKHKAFLRDWAGWRWCFKDWYRFTKYHSEGRLKKLWFLIRCTKIF